jgi:hypothetical protein
MAGGACKETGNVLLDGLVCITQPLETAADKAFTGCFTLNPSHGIHSIHSRCHGAHRVCMSQSLPMPPRSAWPTSAAHDARPWQCCPSSTMVTFQPFMVRLQVRNYGIETARKRDKRQSTTFPTRPQSVCAVRWTLDAVDAPCHDDRRSQRPKRGYRLLALFSTSHPSPRRSRHRGTLLLVLIAVCCSSSSRLPVRSAHRGMAFWQPHLPYRTLPSPAHDRHSPSHTAAPRYTILAGAHVTSRGSQIQLTGLWATVEAFPRPHHLPSPVWSRSVQL